MGSNAEAFPCVIAGDIHPKTQHWPSFGCILIAVKVVFASRELERAYVDVSRATREWGHPLGLRYIQRVKVLIAANNLHELGRSRALRLHPLKGNRRGEWAMGLQGRWRLTVESIDEQTVRVKEVSAHYGD